MIDIKSIYDKRDILYALVPFSEGVKHLKRRADLVDFAYSDLRLFGSSITREGVTKILEGVTIPEAPVFEHRLCEAHRKLLSRFEDKLHMGLDVDSILLNEFCMTLSSSDLPPYREGMPLLYHLDFVPGDDDRISSDLAEMLSAVKRAEKDGAYEDDFCVKAAAIHMGIIKVYPYAEGFSEMSARAAMQYELVKTGYFPVDIEVTESEYNRVCADAVRTGHADEFADLLRKAVYKKLHMLIDAVERGV